MPPINYPTVPRGSERLRITPSLFHSDADIEHLVNSLAAISSELGLAQAAYSAKELAGKSAAGELVPLSVADVAMKP